MTRDEEVTRTFDCFGSTCTAFVTGAGQAGAASDAVAMVRRTLLAWHRRFSRFLPDSELSRLNGDPRELVRVSPLMARLARAVAEAGSLTGGLVDATLLAEIERAGYVRDLDGSVPLALALALAPPRRPPSAAPSAGWRELELDFGVRPEDLHRPAIDLLTRPNPDDPTGRSTMRSPW